MYSYCSLSVCKGHRFILETVAPFHNRVEHTVKQALKMLGFIRYVTCYSVTVDSPIIVHCATGQSKLEFASFVTAYFAIWGF
jgi:hypothetical protein